MITSSSLQVILTALCSAAGIVHLFLLLHPGRSAPERGTDLAHLAMSAAMVAMCWSWGMNLPRRPQEVLFGLAVLWFLLTAARPTWCSHEGLRVAPYHAVMMAGMLWMVAEMPDLMPGSGPAGGSGMDMPGMSMPTGGGSAADRPWTVPAVGYGLVAVFTIGAWWWAARALDTVRSPDHQHRPREAVESAGHGAMSLAMAAMILVLL